jgi:two-component system response regulator FixJ
LIIMTAHADIALAVEAMKGGAIDFIEKPVDHELLLGAIQTALSRSRGESKADERSAEVRARLKLLSSRERQVLEGVVAGKSNKTIARDLELSARTVEAHRANVMAKMQADSISALVRLVLVSNSST